MKRGLVFALAALVACATDDTGTGPGTDPEPSEGSTGPRVVASVEVSPGVDTLAVYDTRRLEAKAYDSLHVEIDDAQIAWSSSDTTIAVVDNLGRVSARSEGEVVIVATSGAHSDSAFLKIYRVLTFASDRTGNADIFQISLDGEFIRNLTQHPDYDATPAWSPDRKRLAFVRGEHLYVLHTDGPALVRIADDVVGYPTWSPDGTKVAFVAHDPYPNLEIHVVNADGTGRANITNSAAADQWPAWSPTGDKILFVSDRDGSTNIYAMNPDGSDVVQITNTTDAHNLYPSWSPDGQKILFVHAMYEGEVGWGIYTMDADGGNMSLLIARNVPSSPTWSPDGLHIAFIDLVDGKQDLFIMDADGTNVRRLTNDAALDMHPAWR